MVAILCLKYREHTTELVAWKNFHFSNSKGSAEVTLDYFLKAILSAAIIILTEELLNSCLTEEQNQTNGDLPNSLWMSLWIWNG